MSFNASCALNSTGAGRAVLLGRVPAAAVGRVDTVCEGLVPTISCVVVSTATGCEVGAGAAAIISAGRFAHPDRRRAVAATATTTRDVHLERAMSSLR
jgi:hypothetical protein